MDSKGSDISLITLSNYVRPALVENKNNDWVLNGQNNSFYQYIIDRNNGSPTNSSINRSYSDLIYGKGLTASNASRNPVAWAKFVSLLSKKDLKRIISDFQIFGSASFQVIKTKGGKDISQIVHVAQNKLAPSLENEDGEIEGYWFSNDWSKQFQTANKPVFIPAFGASEGGSQIYVIRPYSAGKEYFSDPDYLAGLPYAEMEEETANMNINSIKNGLSFGYIINVPNGITWTDEQKKKFKKSIDEKLVGSPNASSFILSFNGADVEITITPFPVNENVHKQWEFLTAEAKQQILTAHRATSPSIVGIVSSSGFSNTADEMDTAEAQLVKRVIYPKQQYILDALEDVLVEFGINLDLYFKPFTDEAVAVEMSAQKEHVCMSDDGASGEMAEMLISLGEDISSDEWTMLSSADVDYNTDDDLQDLIQLSTSTGTARPNSKSAQDSKDIAIRYRYVGNPLPQRAFCIKMMLADKLYRKEDILQMNKSGVNDGFGLGGSNSYSIWLWKGGGKLSANFPEGTCKHKWQREIYLKKGGGVDVNSPLAETISTSEARRKGYKVPKNNSDVSIAPHDNK